MVKTLATIWLGLVAIWAVRALIKYSDRYFWAGLAQGLAFAAVGVVTIFAALYLLNPVSIAWR